MEKTEAGLLERGWEQGNGRGSRWKCSKVGREDRSGSKRRGWDRPGDKRLGWGNARHRMRKNFLGQRGALAKVQFVSEEI